MNYLWAFMILTGVVFAAFHGTLPAVTQAQRLTRQKRR